MRKLLTLVIVLAAASVAAAQGSPPPAAPPPAGLTVGPPVWSEIPVTYTPGNPYSSGGGVRPGAFRNDPSRPAHVRVAVAQATPRATGHGSRSSLPSWREASVALTNAGAKEVRSVRLDFVFADGPGGAEVLRLGLSARKRLRAGETKTLKKTVRGTAANRRGDGAHASVEIREVVYADGSVWRPGESR